MFCLCRGGGNLKKRQRQKTTERKSNKCGGFQDLNED